MRSAEFATYRDGLIADYGAQQARAGNWKAENANQLATEQTDQLLPDGADTEGMLLLVAETPDGVTVGTLWIELEHRLSGAYIYDIEIVDSHRGRGYGRSLLRAAEQELRRRGISSVALNVFTENTAARRLYEKAGYTMTSMMMRKELDSEIAG